MTYVVAAVMSIILNIFLVLLKSIANRPEPINIHSARYLMYCGSIQTSDVVKDEPGWAHACPNFMAYLPTKAKDKYILI